MRTLRVRKRALELDAVRWTMKNADEVVLWAQTPLKNKITIQPFYYDHLDEPIMEMILPSSGIGVPEGGWIIKHPDGELSGCSVRSFHERFEVINKQGN